MTMASSGGGGGRRTLAQAIVHHWDSIPPPIYPPGGGFRQRLPYGSDTGKRVIGVRPKVTRQPPPRYRQPPSRV